MIEGGVAHFISFSSPHLVLALRLSVCGCHMQGCSGGYRPFPRFPLKPLLFPEISGCGFWLCKMYATGNSLSKFLDICHCMAWGGCPSGTVRQINYSSFYSSIALYCSEPAAPEYIVYTCLASPKDTIYIAGYFRGVYISRILKMLQFTELIFVKLIENYTHIPSIVTSRVQFSRNFSIRELYTPRK